jgi:hypothetical protein
MSAMKLALEFEASQQSNLRGLTLAESRITLTRIKKFRKKVS